MSTKAPKTNLSSASLHLFKIPDIVKGGYLPGTIIGGGDSLPVGIEVDYAIRLTDGPQSGQPWNQEDTGAKKFNLNIVPTALNREELGKFAKWVVKEMTAGKKFFMGFSTGRNRVSAILAIIYAMATGKKDASSYIMKAYRKDGFTERKWVDFLTYELAMDPLSGVELMEPVKHNSQRPRFSDGITNYPTAMQFKPAEMVVDQLADEQPAAPDAPVVHDMTANAPVPTGPDEFNEALLGETPAPASVGVVAADDENDAKDFLSAAANGLSEATGQPISPANIKFI